MSTEGHTPSIHLKKPSPRCETLISHTHDVIAVISSDGINHYKSPNVLAEFGLRPEELVGRPALERVHPDELQRVRKELAEIMEEAGTRRQGECRYLHGDGRYRWIEYRATNRLDDPEIGGVILSYRDVTARKEAELELAQSEHKFRALYEQTDVAIILADSKNRVLEANPTACRLLGYSPEELVGMPATELIPPEDLAKEPLDEITREVLQREGRFELEHRFRRKDAELIDVLAKVHEIDFGFKENRHGVASHMISFSDITIRKAAEAQVVQLLREKDLLLREVHHRIKNNLSMLSSMLSIQAEVSQSPETRSALDEARNRVEVLGRIYRQLSADDSVESVSLRQVLGQALVAARELGLSGGSVIREALDDVEVPVRAGISFGIMLNELLTNVHKYAGEQCSEIHVSLQVDTDGTQQFLTLEVKDNGIGFPDRVVEQGEYGFGLLMVETLARQHKGSAVFTNGSDGALAVIRVPVEKTGLRG